MKIKRWFSSGPRLLVIVAMLAFTLLGLSPPLYSSISGGAQKPEVRGPLEEGTGFQVAFDLAHDEIFSPVGDGPMDYSTFYKVIRELGGEPFLNSAGVTPDVLSMSDLYVIAGPAKEFSHAEFLPLSKYVYEGGNLLVLMHTSGPVARLTEVFGIVVSNFVIAEDADAIGGHAQDFYVTRFEEHPVTRNLKKVAVFGTWGLMAEGRATVLASTSKNAWADMNSNHRFDDGEPVAGFGIIAATDFGLGKVLVVADDAPFANGFIREADNMVLVRNVIGWFMGGEGPEAGP
jgi:hypothetical protein